MGGCRVVGGGGEDKQCLRHKNWQTSCCFFNHAACLYKEKKEYYLSDDAFLYLDPVLQQDMNSSVA